MSRDNTPDDTVNRMYLPNERYLVALERLRARIAEGRPLIAEDLRAPGAKTTDVNWGLCSKDPTLWKDKEDHLWPDEFEDHGRVAVKYQEGEQFCPFDSRVLAKGEVDLGPNGCFHRCRVFHPAKFNEDRGLPTRKRALELYDEKIAVAKTLPPGVPKSRLDTLADEEDEQ